MLLPGPKPLDEGRGTGGSAMVEVEQPAEPLGFTDAVIATAG